jgi:hypothetical protein
MNLRIIRNMMSYRATTSDPSPSAPQPVRCIFRVRTGASLGSRRVKTGAALGSRRVRPIGINLSKMCAAHKNVTSYELPHARSSRFPLKKGGFKTKDLDLCTPRGGVERSEGEFVRHCVLLIIPIRKSLRLMRMGSRRVRPYLRFEHGCVIQNARGALC